MPLKFTHSAVLVHLLLLCSFTAISAHEYEDPTIKTMEDFSGYPIHESHSTSHTTLSSLSVGTQSLQKQIDELSTISDAPAPSVTRVLYTDKDVLARREGYNSDLSAVATGSHIDAIPYSGKYDGVVGVLGAIEVINVPKRSGFKPKRSLGVILFTSEEPTRFGISCLGSCLMAGIEELANALKRTVHGQNISFLDAAGSSGYTKHEDECVLEKRMLLWFCGIAH